MVEEGHNQPNISPKSIKFQETMEKGEEDRISELPDCLLIDILSRLPSTKDVIRISTLSKRWKHLWTLLPNLIFEHEDNGNVPWSDFASFVDKTLTQRPQLNLKKFVLDVFCDIQHNSEVNNWIRYAIRCNVEELNLALWCCCDKDELSLDQSFISNACFTDLALCGCELYSSGAISWKKLKRLCISYVDNLDEDLIEKILSGSPLLETLELSNCSGVWRLNITSKSVKNLVLYEYNGWLFDSVEIKAPNILSLTIEGRMWLSEILLVNVSSLVEANLDYTLKYDERMPKEAEEKMLLRLILNLRHVKDLRIGSSSSKVLSCLEAEGFIIPSNVKIPDGFHERLELGDA